MHMLVAEPDTGLRSYPSRGRGSRDTMGTDGGALQLTLGDRAALAVEAYRAGVTDPFTDVVVEITPLLWHVVRAQNVPRDVAEDVVQGVWLAFVRNAGTLRDPQGALKWLLVTARRAAWEAVRRLRIDEHRSTELPETEPMSLEPGPEDEVLTSERDRALWRNVRALPERCQEILRVMAFADRPSYRLIAESTGMSVTSVGATRGRCLEKLRTLLASDEGWASHA